MKSYLVRFTIPDGGNGYAIVTARSVKDAERIAIDYGKVAGVTYKMYAIEEYNIGNVNQCCNPNSVLVSGITTKGPIGNDGVGITNVTSSQLGNQLTITVTTSNGKRYHLTVDLTLQFDQIYSIIEQLTTNIDNLSNELRQLIQNNYNTISQIQQDLTNLTNNVYTKSEIDEKLANIDTSIFHFAKVLPAIPGEYHNKIWVIPAERPDCANSNVLLEYYWNHTLNQWELIGSINNVLDNYWSKDEIQINTTSDTITIDVGGKTIVLEVPQQGYLKQDVITTTGVPTITLVNPTEGAILYYTIYDLQGNVIQTGSGTDQEITRSIGNINLNDFFDKSQFYRVSITTKNNGVESELHDQNLIIIRKLVPPIIHSSNDEYANETTITFTHSNSSNLENPLQYKIGSGEWQNYDPNNPPVITSTSVVYTRTNETKWENDSTSKTITVGTPLMYYRVTPLSTAQTINLTQFSNKKQKTFPVSCSVSGYGVVQFIYNSTLPNLTSIKDQNGQEYIEQFTASSYQPDGSSIQYKVYTLIAEARQDGLTYTFK